MVEQILSDYGAAYGLKSVALRYFNAAGADPDGETGEAHDPETHLIPLVLDAAAGTRENITILGADYATPDGTCIRDYIHVTDIAEAHVLALKGLASGNLRRAYNLGTGVGISVSEVIEAACRVTRRNIPVVRGPRRSGDPDALWADASRIRTEMGWDPHHSSIDELIKTAWAWHTKDRKS
jgi:UDP-glucose 4-epimerase